MRPDGDGAERPSRPLYGEYATPEEVAALRGIPVTAVAVPVAAPAGPPAAGVARERGWRRFDRPVTIALVLLGVINLVQYSGALLDFEGFLESATATTAFASIDFGEAARFGGFVLFAISAVLVGVSVVASYHQSRRARIAFWIPLVAGALSLLAWVVVIAAIVWQTPGALPPPGG